MDTFRVKLFLCPLLHPVIACIMCLTGYSSPSRPLSSLLALPHASVSVSPVETPVTVSGLLDTIESSTPTPCPRSYPEMSLLVCEE